jgi:DNA-binding NarL/FixJ family response regulator
VFADEGASMATLIGELMAAQRGKSDARGGSVPPSFVAPLVRAFQAEAAGAATHQRPTATSISPPVEPLSEREIEVLRVVAMAGRTKRSRQNCMFHSAR